MPSKRKMKQRGRPTKRSGSYGSRSSAITTAPQRSKFTICRLMAGQIVPDRLIVPMKYTQALTFSGAAGFASFIFSANSVYDPNVTGAGGSCEGFNSLSNLYQRYRVYSSKFRVTAQSGNVTEVVCAIAPMSVSIGSASNASVVASARLAKPHAIKMLPVNGYGPPAVLDDEINISDFVGDSLFDEVSLYGIGAADPVAQYYWAIGTNDLNALAYTFGCQVELEYLTEWSLAKDLPA